MSNRHGGTGGAIVYLSLAAAVLGGSGETIPYAATKGVVETFTVGPWRARSRWPASASIACDPE